VIASEMAAGRASAVAFANANLLNMAYVDPALSGVLTDFLVLNDGSGTNMAARILYGRRLRANLNGTDFTPAFFDAAPGQLRIFLLGAKPEVVERAAAYMDVRWPRHRVVGQYHGFFDDDKTNRVLALVKYAQPDIVLVAMGNGRQEAIAQSLKRRGVGSAWAVGALFDFWVGIQPRAPLIFRQLGIEWVFRLYREPSRLWRRYVLGNPLFLLRVFLQKARMMLGVSR
jgi:exopolysaccharide biosynthesis WecB/TagA/CpsF family protein